VAKVTGGTDPCRLVRQVNAFGGSLGPVVTAPDPCRLARQVKEFSGSARELLHLPHEAAGVEEKPGAQRTDAILAFELLHLPDKPAGVRSQSVLPS
jgi:hypothetical protein